MPNTKIETKSLRKQIATDEQTDEIQNRPLPDNLSQTLSELKLNLAQSLGDN